MVLSRPLAVASNTGMAELAHALAAASAAPTLSISEILDLGDEAAGAAQIIGEVAQFDPHLRQAVLPLVAALAERCAALRDERDALVARVEALEGELDGREAGLG